MRRFATLLRRYLAAATVLCAATRATGAAPTDLTAQARQIARDQLKQFGTGYTARIDPARHVVYVSALDTEHLRQTVALLAAFTDAYRRTLPAARPAWNGLPNVGKLDASV